MSALTRARVSKRFQDACHPLGVRDIHLTPERVDVVLPLRGRGPCETINPTWANFFER